MALYKIPASVILGNDSGDGKRVIGVHQPTNGNITLGKVRMVATDVLYTPPSSIADAPITEDLFGYTIEDIYGRNSSANVRVKFLADTPDPGCGLAIKYKGAFGRQSAQSCRLVGLLEQAQPGDFAIASTIKYHRGNDDNFIEDGWNLLQWNGIPYAYESGLFYRVLSQADCDLINKGTGLLLCTDANPNETAAQRQIAGYVMVVRTHLSWEESYAANFSEPNYSAEGNWASTQGDMSQIVADYAAYTVYGPAVDIHFAHACDFFHYDDGATKPDPTERTALVPAFGNEVDNFWGKSAYHIAQYDQGDSGPDLPFPSYHAINSTDSWYNRIRLKYKTCAADDCRFFIAMDRGISRANFNSDRYDPAFTNGFEGWKAGQFIVATICTTGTNGTFLMPWKKIRETYAPAPADATVSMYTHVVTEAEATLWNSKGFQLVTPTTADSNTTSPTSSYLFGTISGGMRVFDICGLDPNTIVLSSGCDFYPDGATYTPETSLGPVFYAQDMYFFNPTKYTSGLPHASPITVTPGIGLGGGQFNALQFTELGFVSASETQAKPCGYGFTVTQSSGFMIARYILRSTVLDGY